MDPYLHYIASGWKEGRDPSALFSTSYYLAHNPITPGVNPLQNFDNGEWQAGRNPSASLSVSDYLAANPDVKAAGVDAAAHYLASGWTEGRNPSALFDTNFYLTQNPDIAGAHIDPLTHFEAYGWKEGGTRACCFRMRNTWRPIRILRGLERGRGSIRCCITCSSVKVKGGSRSSRVGVRRQTRW